MKKLKHKNTWSIVGLIIIDAILFGATNASKVPSFMLIVGFVFLVITFYLLSYGLLGLVSLYGLQFKNRRRSAAYLCALIGGVVALQSINELSRWDILVWLPLLLVGYLYSAYARSNGRNLEN